MPGGRGIGMVFRLPVLVTFWRISGLARRRGARLRNENG